MDNAGLASLFAGSLLIAFFPPFSFAQATASATQASSNVISIHNGFVYAPAAISFVVDDQKAFVLDVGCVSGGKEYFVGSTWSGSGVRPGMAAPDDSFHELEFPLPDAEVLWKWGRVGNAAVGSLSTDHPTVIKLRLIPKTWPDFTIESQTVRDGLAAEATLKNGQKVSWSLKTDASELSRSADTITLSLDPAHPVHLVAGIGDLPKIADVEKILSGSELAYRNRRPSAAGSKGDFVGAIADNVNNSRIYSSDNKLLAHSVGRHWAKGVNQAPYFCWDSFFTALLASLDDPATARNTVRAVLDCATPQGFVPNFGHWDFKGQPASWDRSQPPVGALCVWKMNQRWPDKAFLGEVYPKLVKWHEWWPKERDGLHDGLLEWGGDGLQGALWETGWDDTPHFQGAKMAGKTMNAYAVDLNSLWSMDAEYLALIADAIGKKEDAATFREEHQQMNRRINETLWNDKLGIYCSRLWGENGKPGEFLTRWTPMNFYPLLCGAPDAERASRMLKVMADPNLFWGKWKLPTLAYNDPAYPGQQYWHGNIWGPVNYLVFQGMKRYASPQMQDELARSSVDLFMKNWTANGACGENYMSTDGTQAQKSSDRNYSWGALLCLIGLENIVDQTNDGKIVTKAPPDQGVTLHNIPLGGKLYSVKQGHGKTTLEREPQ